MTTENAFENSIKIPKKLLFGIVSFLIANLCIIISNIYNIFMISFYGLFCLLTNAIALLSTIRNNTTADGLISAVTQGFGYPFVVQVLALCPGIYFAPVTHILTSHSLNSFVDNDPLSVTITWY